MLAQRLVPTNTDDVQKLDPRYSLKKNLVKDFHNCIRRDHRVSTEGGNRVRLRLKKKNRLISAVLLDVQEHFSHNLDRIRGQIKYNYRNKGLCVEERVGKHFNNSYEEAATKTDRRSNTDPRKHLAFINSLPIFASFSELSKSHSESLLEDVSEPTVLFISGDNFPAVNELKPKQSATQNVIRLSALNHNMDDLCSVDYSTNSIGSYPELKKETNEFFLKVGHVTDSDALESSCPLYDSFEPIVENIVRPSTNCDKWNPRVFDILHSKKTSKVFGAPADIGTDENNLLFVWEFRDNKFVKTPCKPLDEDDFEWDIESSMKERFSIRKCIRKERMRVANKMYYWFKNHFLKDAQ